ncbi:PEP-CTERM sorting domain-containing protein [Massilia aquatica]|uniref:PEP-CTERM sorting domain-containing protein n=1 Tax=Massilia aquatica TaxID=2609000 RepID=A0ABX0LY13_9BURK|nr:PEP-CTERM sorting domain-containing protein [Massilia aquatica]NHZ39746.1 PEP-CTERM sorting domain-containing protein [Massilia aquatica]
MLRYLACAATAFMFAAPAHAALQTYDWTFNGGFLGLESGSPFDGMLQGTFTVDDVNADGKFDKAQLQALSYNGKNYPTCDGCSISSFSWMPGSAPEFSIYFRKETSEYYSSESLTTGQSYGFSSGSYSGGAPSIAGGRWTSDVTYKVSAVPEPQTWLMLGAGLLAIGAAVRRRKAA